MVLVAVVGTLCPLTAHAGWGIGVSIGVPGYPRPWYGYPCYRPYYPYPYPYYVVPPAVVVAPGPVVPAVPAPVYAAPAPAPSGVAVADARYAESPEKYLLQLNDPDQQTRIDAILQLGRFKSRKAIDPLSRILTTDRSPSVREAAARSLGMIGRPAVWGASACRVRGRQPGRAAVRQFAAETIRSSLQRAQ